MFANKMFGSKLFPEIKTQIYNFLNSKTAEEGKNGFILQ